jgi:hypothetical protein
MGDPRERAAARGRVSLRALKVAATVCCTMIAALAALAGTASAAYENVPTPTVEGPIAVTETSHPFLATNIPLASYGYTEEEFFITGTGYTYSTSGAVNVNGSKITTGGPNSNGTYPFKTRIVVRRPTNPAKFNGKVVVEWNNVTAGYDLEANWFGDPYYLLKNGYAWVGVSAQNVGVNYLKTFDPSRYGSLEVGPSGDALSYDIYAAAIKAVRGLGVGPEPLGNLTPNITKVTASGESQSCSRLVTYFNKVAPLQQIADNYLMTVCTGAIRADRPEKVLRIITEFENKVQQTEAEAPANPSLRHWEAAGASHVPFLAVANWTIPVDRDTGEQIAKCTSPPLSRVQWPYLVNDGTRELDEWSEGGSAPPIGPRGEYVNSTTLKRNAQGNALGGIRLSDMNVATGVNRGDNSAAPPPNPYASSAFCTLLGQYTPFSEETLTGLYSDYGDYVDKVKADVQQKVSEGFILAEDGTRMVDSAEEFPGLRPTVPTLGGSSPNTGTFSLGWRGAVPSHEQSVVANTIKTVPTFEVQHRDAGGEWTTIATGLPTPAYSVSGEEEGTWSYRVRSRTVVPAFKIEPEQVIVTAWSQALEGVVVDRTAPNAPTASADRTPDYAGNGGWFKDSVTVSFTANGDPALPDGSPGSGVDPASIPAPQTFTADGAHTASGILADLAGNLSAAGVLTVQVDSSAPIVEVTCPAMVSVGAGASATITADDGQSGLAVDPTSSVVIDTSKGGPQTVTATAVDNVGHETSGSCTTAVGFTQVISGNVKGKLVVKAGQSVELAAGAKVSGTVAVKSGGALVINGAKVSGTVSANKAALLRICGSAISGALKVANATGAVVVGDGSSECAGNTLNGTVTLKAGSKSTLFRQNSAASSVKVLGNADGATVIENQVAGTLTVTGNSGTVLDTPNEVEGKSKLQ